MASNSLSHDEIANHYRVLGLAVGSSKNEVRNARNRLLMKFHPDRKPIHFANDVSPETRVHLVQTAYQYIISNYSVITKMLAPISETPLTNAMAKPMRSHWIYSEVGRIAKEK